MTQKLWNLVGVAGRESVAVAVAADVTLDARATTGSCGSMKAAATAVGLLQLLFGKDDREV